MQDRNRHRYAEPKTGSRDMEPRFDADRVVWDVRYRRRVIDRLRVWRQRQYLANRHNGASASIA
ncbi:MAG: hypothetical protein ACTSWM_03960 [Alphaproteobacteria bacterium]